MSTLVRLPDQFTPGGIAVQTAATPTCCCCCCCVVTLTATATALPAGLHSDLRDADPERRRWAARAMALPLLLLAPPFLLSSDQTVSGQFILVQLTALAASMILATFIAAWAGAPNPWLSTVRLLIGAVCAVIEFFLVLYSGLLLEVVSLLAIPVTIGMIIGYYRGERTES